MNLRCTKKIQLKIVLVGLVTFLNCAHLQAADDDLLLENEIDQSQTQTTPNQPSNTTIPTSEQPTSEDLSLDAALQTPPSSQQSEELPMDDTPAGPVGRSDVEYDREELQVQSIEQEYAMKGFAMGFVAYNHNYNVDAKIRIDSADLIDISSVSPDFQSAGVAFRYAILPYNKFGTDLNLSLASSLNHTNNNFAAIMTAKAEVNIGYALRVANLIPIYILAGIGFEVTKGTDIEKIMDPGGGTIQIGGGFGLGQKINLEFFYSVTNHAVSRTYFDKAAQAALNSGATAVGIQGLKSHVSSNILLGKLSVNF